mgnify:CR=1 FL=1
MGDNSMQPYAWLVPAIKGGNHACSHCGVISDTFSPDDVITVGFGSAALYCNGAELYSEPYDEQQFMTGAQAEQLAAKSDPDNDWRITIYGPLSGRTYQRHSPNQWVLIEQNEGFA